jgi:SH3-like domain-containing protein
VAEKRAEAVEASTRRAAEAEAARKHAGVEGEAAWAHERAAEAARKRAARAAAPHRVESEAKIALSQEALAVTTRVAGEPGAPTALPSSPGQMACVRGPSSSPLLSTV